MRSSCSTTAGSSRTATTRSCWRQSRAVPRDRREGPARPGLPDQRSAARARGERAMSATAAARGWSSSGPRARTLASGQGERAPRKGSRGRNLRGLLALLRPYRAARRRDAASRWCSARPPRWRRRCWRRLAIDEGIDAPRHGHARAGRDRVPGLGAARVGDDLRADLPRRLGRPARARGPAHPHLHPPAAASRSASTRAAPRAC